MHSARIVVPLACVALLLGGCVPRTDAASTAPLGDMAFRAPGLHAMLPSLDSSASIETLVAGIEARKAAEAAKYRRAAEIAAAKKIQAARASTSTQKTRGVASSSGRVGTKHVLTEAEKAAAMRAIAVEQAFRNSGMTREEFDAWSRARESGN